MSLKANLEETDSNLRHGRPAADLSSDCGGQGVSPEAYFADCLRRLIRPGERILDAGCGSGKFFSLAFARRRGCRVTGVDRSAMLNRNGDLDHRIRAEVGQLPLADGAFDVVSCRLLVEHLKAPSRALREFHRVLKPGGRLAIFTPNLLHYFGVAASCTPQRFHRWFNSRVRGFAEGDSFPTYYRANTRITLERQLRHAGFASVDTVMLEGAPSVLAFHGLLYRAGLAYKAAVERVDFLSPFRLNIVAIAYKA